MDRKIIMIIMIGVGLAVGIWSAGFWLGGCSSTLGDGSAATTTTIATTSSTTAAGTTTTTTLSGTTTTTTTTSSTTTTLAGSWNAQGGSFIVGTNSLRIAVSPDNGLLYAVYADRNDWFNGKVAVYVPGFDSWAPIPATGESVSDDQGSNHNLCAPSSGKLYAGYMYLNKFDSNDRKVKVKTYNEAIGTWEPFLTDVASGFAGNLSKMQIYSDGVNDTVYLAVPFLSGNCYVYKSQGGGWVNLGGLSSNIGSSNIALAEDGTLYAAYIDYNDSGKIKVKKYSAGSWISQGSGISISGLTEFGGISLKAHGNIPYVAYCERLLGTSEVTRGPVKVKKYVSTTWQDVGSITFEGSGLSLDVYDDGLLEGTPYIAFADRWNNDKLVVKRFNNSLNRWEQVGGYISSYPASRDFFPGISMIQVVEAGKPYVSFHYTTDPDPWSFNKNIEAAVYKYE